MKRIVQLKLVTTPEDHAVLLATLERANDAANALSHAAWDTRTFRQFPLQRATYYAIKARFGLTAQMVVRLTSKVVDAYKLDRKDLRRFRRRGSIAYDDRILRYGPDRVSIWTVEGRRSLPFVCDERARRLLAFRARAISSTAMGSGISWLRSTSKSRPPPIR